MAELSTGVATSKSRFVGRRYKAKRMGADDPRHGTHAGYRAHLNSGEKACQECTDANRAMKQSHSLTPCPRCGLMRIVKKQRGVDLCRDCKHFKESEPEPLTGGRFVRHGLVWRFEIYTCPCGIPIDEPLGTCERCVDWAERDAVKASWRRRQEAA